MRARDVKVKVKADGGLQIKPVAGKPLTLDGAVRQIIQQQAFKQRRVPIESNGGLPIRKQPQQAKTLAARLFGLMGVASRRVNDGK